MVSDGTKALFLITIFIGLATVFSSPKALHAQTFAPENFSDQRFEKYEQQLNAILLTRRVEEREFISIVVGQVRAGILPSKFVQTSFRWVQNNRPHTNFPFIYFERVLRLQANQAGIAQVIPPFDFDIYLEFDSGFRPFTRGGSPTTQGPGLQSDRSDFGPGFSSF